MNKQINLSLMPYQQPFVYDVTTPIIGFNGGMGMGKSVASVNHAFVLSAIHAGKEGALLSPTFGMTQRNLVPLFRKLAEQTGVEIHGLKSKKPDVLEIKWGNKTSTIHLSVSAENHDRFNGMNLAWAGLDEADKCKPEEVVLAVEQMEFRVRDAVNPYPAQIFITSTPEGQAFMYDYFVLNDNEFKKLYRAKTADNYMLSPSYLTRLRKAIPKHKQEAYFNGEFVSLTDGSVYRCYDSMHNKTDLTINDMTDGDALWASFDLNYGGMSCVVFLVRQVGKKKMVYVVKEYMGILDTKVLLDKLKAELPIDKLWITCDPACTQALPIIKDSGLKQRIMTSSPPIEWRVTAVNNKFSNPLDEKPELFVNPRTCPVINKCLLMQQYINGEPDKKTKIPEAKTDVSGPVDALGYGMYLLFPYNPPGNSRPIKLRGF
jgi:hypothetical protein